uniref:Uncharacterized protein n=1 Tax=Arundo donax TaxID=35708 RepID=A0A0A9CBX2_ARUDO
MLRESSHILHHDYLYQRLMAQNNHVIHYDNYD